MPFYQPNNLEYSLAFHCAPTLAGLKPANLVSLPKGRHRTAATDLSRWTGRLCHLGIAIAPLEDSSRRILALLYHRDRLWQHLGQPEHREFLSPYGYRPGDMNLTGMLERLGERVRNSGGQYPHEIGIFLGYPLSDVQGFIRHRGNTCKLCGYWKVYGDAESAKKLFATYDAARSFYCQRVLSGEEIHTIQYGGCFT